MKAARRRREIFWITHAQFVIFNVKIGSNIAIRDGFCEGKRWIWTQNPPNFPLRGYRGLGNTRYNSYLLNDHTHTPDWISLLYFAIVPEYSVEKPFAYLLNA